VTSISGLVEEKEDEKKKEKPPGSVSILQLFKFASPLDITLLLLGTLAGTKQPCMFHPVYSLSRSDIQFLSRSMNKW
jgi:hypothetical protein